MASKIKAPDAKDAVKRTKSLVANYRKATNEFHPYLDFVIDEKEVGHWYCRIRNVEGRDGEFSGGEYIIEMIAPQKYPYMAPNFYVRTPNGVYEGGYNKQVDVCLGNGHMHADQFAAGQGGMMGFIMMTLNGMMNWRLTMTGIGILHGEYFQYSSFEDPCPNERARKWQQGLDAELNREKRAFAAASRAYNRRHYTKIMAQFDELPYPRVLDALPAARLAEPVERAVRHLITGQ